MVTVKAKVQGSRNYFNCRFSIPIPANHYLRGRYPLFCYRFPPAPPSDSRDHWNQRVGVTGTDFCFEFQREPEEDVLILKEEEVKVKK